MPPQKNAAPSLTEFDFQSQAIGFRIVILDARQREERPAVVDCLGHVECIAHPAEERDIAEFEPGAQIDQFKRAIAVDGQIIRV